MHSPPCEDTTPDANAVPNPCEKRQKDLLCDGSILEVFMVDKSARIEERDEHHFGC